MSRLGSAAWHDSEASSGSCWVLFYRTDAQVSVDITVCKLQALQKSLTGVRSRGGGGRENGKIEHHRTANYNTWRRCIGHVGARMTLLKLTVRKGVVPNSSASSWNCTCTCWPTEPAVRRGACVTVAA